MAEAKYYESTRDTVESPPAYTASSGQPELPSYQDVERDAPPPSYESLYGRAKAMKAQSSGNVDFVKKVILLFVGTIGFTVTLGILLAIPIAMIVIGAKYLDDCPAERYIPIYLVVAGSFGVVRNSITIVRRCCQNKEEEGGGGQPEESEPCGVHHRLFHVCLVHCRQRVDLSHKGGVQQSRGRPQFLRPHVVLVCLLDHHGCLHHHRLQLLLLLFLRPLRHVPWIRQELDHR
ncbi:hypothetical protein ACOMHN_055639 [Nucella lapillus]